jgi:transcriptional regulator with XRE-family HTH domain
MALKTQSGKRIATFRTRKGMTQEALAKAIGSSIPTIWRWENGDSEPRASDIQKLCEVLNVTEAELLNGPAKNEWMIEIVWEVSELNALSVEKDKFFIGFRDDDTVLWGSIPIGKTPEEASERIRQELAIALKMREIGEAERKKLK